jgi:hypothetical protein
VCPQSYGTTLVNIRWNSSVKALRISDAPPNVDPMAQCETGILKSSQSLLNGKREGTIYAVYPVEEALQVGSRSLRGNADWMIGLQVCSS